MSFDFSTLITDRTNADVSYLSALMSKKLGEWTPEELDQFNNGLLKGGYWWTDLNRVTSCMEYLNKEILELGYRTGYISTGRVWSKNDTLTASDLAQYLSNIAAIKNAFDFFKVAIEVPTNGEGLNTYTANNIEKILISIENTITAMRLSFVPCGPATCGGDYL